MKKTYICPKEVLINLAGEVIMAGSDAKTFSLDDAVEMESGTLGAKSERRNLWDEEW